MPRLLALSVCLAAALTWVGPVQAAPVPFGNAQVALNPRELPLADFLEQFFAQADLPVVVSPSLRAPISGTFKGGAESVYQTLSKAYNLVTYFDGAVVYVYPANELTSKTFPAGSPGDANRILRAAQSTGLPDARNVLRTDRSGGLTAVGTKRFVEQVEGLTRPDPGLGMGMLGAAAAPLGFRTFYLRYAWAQDTTANFGGRELTVPGVATLLRSLVLGTQSAGNGEASSRQQRPTQPRLGGRGLASIGPQPAGPANLLGLSPLSGGGADPLVASITTAPAPSPSVNIVADPRLNAVIVRDSPERMAAYEQLIASLDLEPQMIELEAQIIDVSVDRLQELGINWRYTDPKGSSALFGNGTNSDLLLGAGQNVTPIGRGFFASLLLGGGDRFVARINALETQGAARIVSRPQVLTLSDVEALFGDSSTFYVRIAGSYNEDLFNVNVGTQMRVTPHVFRDRGETRIKLLIAIDDGRVTTQTVDSIPVIQNSTINTQALLLQGESLLIGGLTRETTSDSVDKIPLLGDIPYLGALFRTTTHQRQRTERLFLISPRLASHDRTSPAAPAATPLLPNPTPAPPPATMVPEATPAEPPRPLS